MTRASGREYAAAPGTRYQQATRAENHRRVDAIVAVTGLPRKAALRLLRRAPRPRPSPGPGGRPREYGPEIAAAAVLWQACGRIGAHRPYLSWSKTPSVQLSRALTQGWGSVTCAGVSGGCDHERRGKGAEPGPPYDPLSAACWMTRTSGG